MTTTKLATAAILMDAARILRERGLARYEFEDCRGRVCAVEAILLAAETVSGDGDEAQAQVRADIRILGHCGLMAYSDHARTRYTVASQFERTAARLMAEEGASQ